MDCANVLHEVSLECDSFTLTEDLPETWPDFFKGHMGHCNAKYASLFDGVCARDTCSQELVTHLKEFFVGLVAVHMQLCGVLDQLDKQCGSVDACGSCLFP